MSMIVDTPSEIAGMISARCHTATFSGRLQDGRYTLRCELPNCEVIEITSALAREQFSGAFTQFVDESYVGGEFDGEQPFQHVFDLSRFTLQAPLREWQVFQRLCYEREGTQTCEALLKEYLLGGDVEDQLMQLGLAQNQVDPELARDLSLFQNLLVNNRDEANDLFARLQEAYPAIYERFIANEREQGCVPLDDTPYARYLRTISARVIGQDGAAELLASTLALQESLAEQNSGRGHKFFLLVGPTGIGKTEMGKAVAAQKENRIRFFSMNQYQSETAMNNFFGASAGYVGCRDLPHFAKELQQWRPKHVGSEEGNAVYEVENVVLLFDEIEKAHHQVKQSLLTLFDEGWCKISYCHEFRGNITMKYRFKSSVFIATSNLLQELIVDGFSAGNNLEQIADEFIRQSSAGILPNGFSPEFLSRAKVIPFRPIPRGEPYQRIIDLKMAKQLPMIQRGFRFQDVILESRERVIEAIEERLYGEGVDIRRVEKFFEDRVTTTIFSNFQFDVQGKILVLTTTQTGGLGVRIDELFYGQRIALTDVIPL